MAQLEKPDESGSKMSNKASETWPATTLAPDTSVAMSTTLLPLMVNKSNVKFPARMGLVQVSTGVHKVDGVILAFVYLN
eukprot:1950664-Rhodomonas_salina.1